jgi:queuine tRNA-ribosyltransferase|tara:strand:+ start:1843 stop:2961 length:1119 start_codon:yes stop_codon:yes gene_type:complete
VFFNLQHTEKDTQARAGLITTDHGDIPTPIFMPVGTQGTVKAVDQSLLKNTIDAKIILGNTYHLYLRPGLDIIKGAGGLHKFINWDRPMLTDSGGFQVYSISDQRKITEEGVLFRSHIDGHKLLFTPENVMDTQRTIGADIIMAFDECTPYPATREYATNSMHTTHRWLDRCITRFTETDPIYGHSQQLFPIIQGSVFEDLRLESTEYCLSKDTDGIAIGGLSVGEPHEDMYRITEQICAIVPTDKPRYLMGVGTPSNILECIHRGVDMFDCVMPTRNARNGWLFTKDGTMNMRNKKWEDDYSAVDDDLSPQYSKAYLKHLFKAKEYLGAQIASEHNLKFYLWLVGEARKHILADTFLPWKNSMVAKLDQRL